MWRMLLAVILLGCPNALFAQANTLRVKPPFQPPEAIYVSDITVPYGCAAYGTELLNALITETGKVQEVEVRRDIACLTEHAVHLVENWKFLPATFAGKVIASRMPVAVTFPEPGSSAYPVTLPKWKPLTAAAIQAEFQPAEVTRAAFPQYPHGAVLPGTVVLEVTLSAMGEAREIKVLHDLPPFTAKAKAVVKDWRFKPATLNGNPVPSNIVLVFVAT